MMKSKWELISSIVFIVIGILAIISFINNTNNLSIMDFIEIKIKKKKINS